MAHSKSSFNFYKDQITFVEPPSHDFRCPICLGVLKEPFTLLVVVVIISVNILHHFGEERQHKVRVSNVKNEVARNKSPTIVLCYP